MERAFEAMAQKVSGWMGQPPAFSIALVLMLVWGATGPVFGWSDTWQLVVNTGTTIVTFLMVFLIQNAQNRDASAIQAKLDELIRATDGARDDFIGIEHRTQRELRDILTAIEGKCRDDSDDERAVKRLIERL